MKKETAIDRKTRDTESRACPWGKTTSLFITCFDGPIGSRVVESEFQFRLPTGRPIWSIACSIPCVRAVEVGKLRVRLGLLLQFSCTFGLVYLSVTV